MPAAADVARTSLLLIFAFAGIECALVPSGEVRDTGAHRAARDRARHDRHHAALHRAADGGAGHSRERPGAGDGLAARRCRRRVARRLGARAAARRRHRLDVRLSRRHDAVDAAHVVRAGARRLSAACAGGRPSRSPLAAGCHPRAVARWRSSSRSQAPSRSSPSSRTCPRSRSTSAARSRRGGCGRLASRRRHRAPSGAARWRVPWLACGVIVWVLTGLTRDEWLGFAVCMGAASIVYVGTRSLRTGQRPDRGQTVPWCIVVTGARPL